MKIYRYSEDKDYLKTIFPRLMLFFESWFSLPHDKDQDGIPEWEHVLQTGFEDNPLFTYWHEWSHGVSIYKVEGPDICSFLYRECISLLEIAKIISNNEAEDSIRKKSEVLRAAVENSWNEQIKCYQYWDRDTHSCTPALSLGMRTGPGDILINKNFDDALRINVFIKANGEIPSNLQLFIHGTTHTGTHRIERISPEQLRWHLRNGYATSDRAFESLDHIHIQGVSDGDIIEIKSLALDHQNQSLLLPLWAGIPSQKRAKLLIKKTLTDQNRYWQEFGVRACAHPPPLEGEASSCEAINILWNSLLVEGLIHYGYRSLAAELIERNMKAIIRSLKEDRAFRRVYSAKSGEGRGEKNIITSLAPLGAFLATLGIQVLSQKKVALNAFNPFPWPVTLKYRGLTIIRQKKNSTLIFPDGKTLTLKNGKEQIVSQD